jgi:hypothetical protein
MGGSGIWLNYPECTFFTLLLGCLFLGLEGIGNRLAIVGLQCSLFPLPPSLPSMREKRAGREDKYWPLSFLLCLLLWRWRKSAQEGQESELSDPQCHHAHG